jgi:transaldolase
MISRESLNTKIFADGADLQTAVEWARDPLIRGFTTNPTLMRKAGVEDYAAFAHSLLEQIPDRPISFEVLSDDPMEMHAEAVEIANWGPNVYVKVPVTTTRGESTVEIVKRLTAAGVQVNVTAVFTPSQVETIAGALAGGTSSVVSILAGRIADTGLDPVPIMSEALGILRAVPKAELLWASPREVLNIVQASEIGCHIVTVTPDLLAKLHLLGKDLLEFSLETVKMFHDDARAAGLTLQPAGVGA